MRVMTWLFAISLGCTPPDDSTSDSGRGRPRPVDTGVVATGDTALVRATASTASSGDTAITEPTDCSIRPKVGPVTSTGYFTEEDFDFDPRGYMVSQKNRSIEGLDRYGNTRIYAANVGVDPAGLRILASGDLAVAQPDLGSVVVVSTVSGGQFTAVSGLTFPNGLEADTRGYLFVSEYQNQGRVRQVDPYTGEQWLVVDGMAFPNGVALSPDENTLYVAESNQGGRIVAIDRLTDTTWGDPRVVFEPPSGSFFTIAVDECGNLYIVDFSGGDLYRVPADGTPAEHLVDIDSVPGAFSAMRFGNGIGGWERDRLYATRRGEFYEIIVGIKGREPVYDVY
jgi:DNA-binding beta-propeller fold protein YncE